MVFAHQERYRSDDGLAVLGPEPTELVRQLDETFREWALCDGAQPMTAPALLPVGMLAKLDVYANFPHMALVAGRLRLEDGGSLAAQAADGEFPPESLHAAALALPSTVCYGVYAAYSGTTVEDTAVTLVGQCFRNEEHYDGLRRLRSFRMREVVALGSAESARDHLDRYSTLIGEFAKELGLPLDRVAAADPFYDRAGSRALLQSLLAVKHEFVYRGMAVASVNEHRNFFGERCAIAQPSGAAAFSSCVGFGFERWVSALIEHFAGDWDAAIHAVARTRAGVGLPGPAADAGPNTSQGTPAVLGAADPEKRE